MPRKENNMEATSYPDGLREGVMSDSTGVEFGIKLDAEQVINPAQIADLKKAKPKKPGANEKK